jgi:hypothetical protein
LADNNGGTISFYCKRASYDESYKVGYSTTTNDPSAFTFGTEVTEITELYAEQTATFPAGTKYIAIASTAYDAFYLFVDDITITADVTSGGGSTDPVYQIADMYVPAGTYYVAVASKTENFQVDMMTSEVPVPEQAVVVSPYDGRDQRVRSISRRVDPWRLHHRDAGFGWYTVSSTNRFDRLDRLSR